MVEQVPSEGFAAPSFQSFKQVSNHHRFVPHDHFFGLKELSPRYAGDLPMYTGQPVMARRFE